MLDKNSQWFCILVCYFFIIYLSNKNYIWWLSEWKHFYGLTGLIVVNTIHRCHFEQSYFKSTRCFYFKGLRMPTILRRKLADIHLRTDDVIHRLRYFHIIIQHSLLFQGSSLLIFTNLFSFTAGKTERSKLNWLKRDKINTLKSLEPRKQYWHRVSEDLETSRHSLSWKVFKINNLLTQKTLDFSYPINSFKD